jgi:hypothetical protein
MWDILQAELYYKRIGLALVYLVVLLLWIVYLFDPAGIFVLFLIPWIPLTAVLLTGAAKEKRERVYAILPVSIEHRGLAFPVLFMAFYGFCQLSAWPVQFLIERSELANEFVSLWGLFSLSGLTISLVLLVLIHVDLGYSKKRNYRWAVRAALLAVFLLFTVINFGAHVEPVNRSGLDRFMYELPFGAIFVAALSVGLLYLRVTIYARRDSYLS